jgi:hypothetical protein
MPSNIVTYITLAIAIILVLLLLWYFLIYRHPFSSNVATTSATYVPSYAVSVPASSAPSPSTT